jgi:hypothetical protein
MSTTTEIILRGGNRYRVEGEAHDVERWILDAGRGSIMEFAWLVEAEPDERVGISPDSVVLLRAVGYV